MGALDLLLLFITCASVAPRVTSSTQSSLCANGREEKVQGMPGKRRLGAGSSGWRGHRVHTTLTIRSF